jgi:hypothetical protein
MKNLKRWCESEDNIICQSYPDIGPSGVMPLLLNRTHKSIINRAYRLKVEYKPKQRETYCIDCNKRLFSFNKKRNKYYAAKSKGGRCFRCACVARTKPKPTPLFKSNRFDWIVSEVEMFTKLYPTTDTKELASLFNRSVVSLMKKAHRLGIKKTNDYFVQKGKKNNFFSNNPMCNPEIKSKVKQIKKDNYASGKTKVSGIALKSMQGLTKMENHPNWLGGKSFEPYTKEFNEQFKQAIKLRDNDSCVICGSSKTMTVHHINYNKLMSTKENCILLCNSCHAKTNFNRKYWQSFFQSMLSDRYGYTYIQLNLEVCKNESN